MPGWCQIYSNKKKTGFGFIAGAISLGAMAYLSHADYQSSFNDFNDLYGQYLSSSNPIEKADFKSQAQTSHEVIINSSDQVNTMLYGLAAIWIVNMVHAALVEPEEDIAVSKSDPNLIVKEVTENKVHAYNSK